MKAYITCPLANSKDKLHLLPVVEAAAKAEGLDTFVFIIGGAPPVEIFERDYNQIKSSDLIIAEVSEPSHGVGIEIGLSYALGLKRILLVEEGRRLSSLLQGMPDTIIIEYKDVEELIDKLRTVVRKLV